ncbi:MAG: aldo/keto reductase [Opitutaceae bacterium]|nr:aldo/keto reductase [Opitutaceae bacterium]
MNRTTTGPAGLTLSNPGLGCVTFGREIDAAASFQLMDFAVARGVTFFDTAVAYANGASETIIGDWLASRRPAPGGVTVASKILPPYEPARIRQEVDKILGRLRVPALDLLYLHKWDATAEAPEALAALDGLVKAGRVRALGVSNYTSERLERALRLQAEAGLARFQYLQNNHNLAVREADTPYREWCARQGVAVVTFSPLGAGFLTGKHRQGVQAGSRFELIPGHQAIYFQDLSWRRLARLEAVAARLGRTSTELALAWALHQPGIASVLIGGRNSSQLEQALQAQAFNDPAVFAELAQD